MKRGNFLLNKDPFAFGKLDKTACTFTGAEVGVTLNKGNKIRLLTNTISPTGAPVRKTAPLDCSRGVALNVVNASPLNKMLLYKKFNKCLSTKKVQKKK
ncbi:MAG: hypothetical protein KVP17_002377 [Porospora cf. gigantea B]|uniref:uncharacterized protein n=1 Tax=Porospora cf. gigantea A TaxID=2853593 RepID=UPI00355A2EA5|nr:MAG: hypothetical protein KVP18_000257 [Porospora cf. gigantea A]KAH0487383.1 MAG: hypothetical protein KVP17_002377 [Porospora cf. gigantea B]